jgi:hypothetical protein
VQDEDDEPPKEPERPPPSGGGGTERASGPTRGPASGFEPASSRGGPSIPPPSRFVGAGRLAFAAAWITLQVALILTANRRADAAFGFRMFSESTTLKVALYREVATLDGSRTRVHVDDGTWSARDDGGMVRRFAWSDRIRIPYWVFDREMHASYGAAAQLSRLQAALDDVAAHVPDDAETRRLLLDVTIRRNGREAQTFHLTSPERGSGTR